MAQVQNIQDQRNLLHRGMEQVGWFKSKKIPVHTPGEVEYERAVANSNLLYRFARPACVLQPEHNSHIRIIIARAKEKKLPICIKNGGHSYAGFSTINDGLLIDLVNMNKVDLDIEHKTITMQAGAQWGHAYKELINGHHDGWVINGGRCPTVGVSGFILGGGLSPFTRSFGMGSDTLLEATIITADGKTVIAKNTDKAKKEERELFWALCGAGGGNFGVVVELKMQLQELHAKDVVAGRFTWSPKHCEKAQTEFMETMVKFYTTDWPNEMTIDSSWLCDLKEKREDPAVRFLVYYNGLKKDFNELINVHLDGLRDEEKKKKKKEKKYKDKEKELPKQLKRRTLQERSTRFLHETLVAQWSEETIRAFPSNPTYKVYTSFVFGNGKDEIKKITEIIKTEMEAFREKFKGEQGLLQVTWIHCGGKASEKEPDASAYPWRKGVVYHAYIMIEWQEKFLELDMRSFLEKMNAKLRPFSHSQKAVFINFPDQALKPDAHEDAYYGPNKERLRKIKARWDEDDVFGWSQGIQAPKKAVVHHQGDGCVDVAGHDTFLMARVMVDVVARGQWETFSAPPVNVLVGGVQGVTGFAF